MGTVTVTATENKIGFPIYDMHSHILPGVDDGCQTAEESLTLLRQSAAQGVGALFATPHFYPERSAEDFLQSRAAAAETLRSVLPAEEALPPFALGAEVAYHPGLTDMDRLPELCLGKTGFLLLELPFYPWSRNLLRDVAALQNYFGIQLIIAHIDRYLGGQDGAMIRELFSLDVAFQLNAEAVLSPRTARKAKHLLKDGIISLLGSDCHDPQRRPQRMGDAVEKLLSWHLDDAVREIGAFSRDLFDRSAGQ